MSAKRGRPKRCVLGPNHARIGALYDWACSLEERALALGLLEVTDEERPGILRAIRFLKTSAAECVKAAKQLESKP